MPKIIDPVDLHVGQRIRARREALGMNQSDLARELNLTFQQVQKYEKGDNRVSASKLAATAKALKVSVGYFFPDFQEPAAGAVEERFTALCRMAVEKWGVEKQWDMVQEEALELALEVHGRGRDKTSDEKIANEVADMEIMCGQARQMLPAGMVDQARTRKEARLEAKLEAAG